MYNILHEAIKSDKIKLIGREKLNIIKIVKSATEMTALAETWNYDAGCAIVPTMGALHEGHLTLVRHAKAAADRVIVSIFVNPLQFGPGEDFDRYPRNLEEDSELLQSAGADIVFTPNVDDMTPADMRVTVDPGPMGDVLCGQYRPGHFRGVCTIVTKLFHITRPGQAYFGWKDAQQFLILRKMVQDLNFPVAMHGIETMREADGLAMSSRNAYLNPDERHGATVLFRSLEKARTSHVGGQSAAVDLTAEIRGIIATEPLAKLQYCEVMRMDTLEPVDNVLPGNTLIAVAAHFGETRLIDNIRL